MPGESERVSKTEQKCITQRLGCSEERKVERESGILKSETERSERRKSLGCIAVVITGTQERYVGDAVFQAESGHESTAEKVVRFG